MVRSQSFPRSTPHPFIMSSRSRRAKRQFNSNRGLCHGAAEETVGDAPAATVASGVFELVTGVAAPGTAVVLVAAGALVAGVVVAAAGAALPASGTSVEVFAT